MSSSSASLLPTYVDFLPFPLAVLGRVYHLRNHSNKNENTQKSLSWQKGLLVRSFLAIGGLYATQKFGDRIGLDLSTAAIIAIIGDPGMAHVACGTYYGQRFIGEAYNAACHFQIKDLLKNSALVALVWVAMTPWFNRKWVELSSFYMVKY